MKENPWKYRIRTQLFDPTVKPAREHPIKMDLSDFFIIHTITWKNYKTQDSVVYLFDNQEIGKGVNGFRSLLSLIEKNAKQNLPRTTILYTYPCSPFDDGGLWPVTDSGWAKLPPVDLDVPFKSTRKMLSEFCDVVNRNKIVSVYGPIPSRSGLKRERLGIGCRVHTKCDSVSPTR